MAYNLKGRNFLTLKDYSSKEIEFLIDLSQDLRKQKYAGVKTKALEGKNIALIFEKPSTRTRLSFETAMYNLGGRSIVMDFKSSQISRGEAMSDTARVLSRYGHVISARLFKQETLEEIALRAGAHGGSL